MADLGGAHAGKLVHPRPHSSIPISLAFPHPPRGQSAAAESCAAAGKHSTWGIGRTAPDEAGAVTLADGVKVPMGREGPNAKYPASRRGYGGLQYNEYIVYKPEQVRMRYVVQLKFKYH